MTSSCAEADSVILIAKTQLSKNFLSRVNSVQDRLCEIYDRTNTAEFAIRAYCPDVTTSIEASSSSSSEEPCFKDCECNCENNPPLSYLISDEMRDDDMVDLLIELEQDVCESVRLLKELEQDAADNCVPDEPSSSSSEEPSSSSEEPSSSSSEEPSSSSSEPSSSSSEESSSSSEPAPPPTVFVIADCEDLGIEEGLVLYFIDGRGYVTEEEYNEYASSSADLSSSAPSSSSGSSYVDPGYSLHFNTTWEIRFNDTVIATSVLNDPNNPYGSYIVIANNQCKNSLIIVE